MDGTHNAALARRIVTREEWLAERRALLEQERAVTHALDRIRAARRALPWVRIETPYVFEGPEGRVTLAELFGPRTQLAVYHFMLAPESDHICPGCAFIADHVDAARQHFEQADLSFAAISRATLPQIEAVRHRMGWRFAWVSSHGSSFNYDFGVSFTPEQVAAGRTGYNFGTTPYHHLDQHGTSLFVRDEEGAAFHAYSCYARGDELLIGAFNWLDLAPKGRNERGTMSWVKLHDEYGTAPKGGCCAH
ncbi:DUF899 domain-containing protein [Elioraea rosea]|uniref:DUF899 domain-containing protein n=1 Tax=Elioraea rosea TaxID=2492390 RepID=UPI001183A26E|nr:thioredoxin family protein [Elioraea rosea]